MMALLAGAGTGAAVCVFGMWAFLKGQSSMLEIHAGGRPRLREQKPPGDGLSGQLAALFSDGAPRQETR